MYEPENYLVTELCPILNRECVCAACKWYLPFAEECAVTTIACVLADSTICQNVWGNDT